MSKYIAIDAGKSDTKFKSYDSDTKAIVRSKFRTKISPGTFEDDFFERGTFIAQIDENGPVYKIGHGGTEEPALETSKKSEIHRICTMAAAALACGGPGTFNDVKIVIGVPLQICSIPEQRIDYKKYILGEPGEEHIVRIKTDCNGPVHEIRLTFSKELVYPEGIGVLYEYPKKLGGQTGIIDIGNLNTNNIYCDTFSIVPEDCFTDELGSRILLSNLASQLTSELNMRVTDRMAESVLRLPVEKRHLVPWDENPEIIKKSGDLITQFLTDHAKLIRQKCATRHWPMDFMNLVCMGGTSKLLRNELTEVFGSHIFIPENPEYVNVDGFLRKMCADEGIDIGHAGSAGEKKKENS